MRRDRSRPRHRRAQGRVRAGPALHGRVRRAYRPGAHLADAGGTGHGDGRHSRRAGRVRRPPRPARRRMSSAARWGTSGFITPGILAAGLTASSLSGSASWTVMAIVVALGYFIVWLSAGA